MTDVFLSYKREDAPKARKLVTAIRQAALEVWWDEDILPSAPWEATIEKALAAAKTVIVCWSPASVASENVRSEARVAREDGRLIQVFLRPCSPPLFFGERQGVDLIGWRGNSDDPRIAKIVAAVKEETAVHAGNATTDNPRMGFPKNRRLAVLVAVVCLLLVVTGVFVWRQTMGRPEPEIAVLPFEDLSPGHDKAFFAEGVSEEILSSLSTDKGIKVLGRSSSLQIGQNADPTRLRSSLGITHLLEGSAETAGDALRVNVRLIDTADGSTLWHDEFHGRLADIFGVQDKIATAVVKQVHGVLAGASAVGARPMTNTDSYQSYLAARALMRSRSKPTLQRALALATQVIHAQPNYAPGQALYAELTYHLSDDPLEYGDMPVAKAREIARAHALRAIKLAPWSADGYAALGLISPREQAIAPLTRAIALDPSRGELRMWLEEAYSALGDYDNAFKQAKLAVEIEPLWAATVNRLVLILAASRRFDGALAAVHKFEAMGGDPAQVLRFRGSIARRQGNHAQASSYGEQALARDPSLPYVRSQVALDYHLLGLDDRARARFSETDQPFARLFISNQRPLIVEAARSSGPDFWDAPDVDMALFALGTARAWGPLAGLYRKAFTTAPMLCTKLTSMGLPLGMALPVVQGLAAAGSGPAANQLLGCVRERLERVLHQSYRSGDDFAAEVEAEEAMTLALSGDKKGALNWLKRAIDLGWLGYPYSARLVDWPELDGLRDDPRLGSLQSEMDNRIAAQRRQVLGRH